MKIRDITLALLGVFVPIVLFANNRKDNNTPISNTTIPPTTSLPPSPPAVDDAQVWIDALPDIGAIYNTNRIAMGDIYRSWRVYGDGDNRKLAYIIATAWHESRLGVYMTELSSGSQYEGRTDLGNTELGDGPLYKGRGYTQITGRTNYQKYSNILGIDLISDPERATESRIAADIMVHGMMTGSFTGRRLSDYFSSSNEDPYNARRIVNGIVRSQAQSIEDDYYILIDNYNNTIA